MGEPWGIECLNARDVVPDCLNAAVAFVRSRVADNDIEEIWFGDDWLEVERFALPRIRFPFNVVRKSGLH